MVDKTMKKVATYLLVLISIIFFTSCKKEDTPPPSKINILSPVANTPFEVNDTITIKLLIDSRQPEVDLWISLLDANFSPASPINPLVFSDFETNIETTLHFMLDDEFLESGNYYLFFKVLDQSGNVNKYLSIYIEGIQRQFEGIFIVSEISDNQIGIEKLGTDLTGQGIKILEGNYAGSSIDSRYKNIYVAGQNFGNLVAMNTDSLGPEWEIPIIPNPVQPYFTFVQQIDHVLYVGFYSGEVNGYNPSGDLIFTTQTNGLTFPNQVCIVGNHLVVSSTTRSNLFEYWIETFFMASGVDNSKTKVLIKPIHLKPLDDEQVLMFGNNGNSRLETKLLDPETGLVSDPYQPFQLPDELVKCAADINNEQTLLGLEDGIYIYDYQRSIAMVTTSISPRVLHWEDISQNILAADGDKFFTVSANGQQIFEHDYPYPIYNLLLNFNK
jgi:hypothetical protein